MPTAVLLWLAPGKEDAEITMKRGMITVLVTCMLAATVGCGAPTHATVCAVSAPKAAQTVSDVSFTREAWQGKKAVVFGDSITARAYLQSNDKDYIDVLSENLGFSYTRLAVRGSRLTPVLDNPVDIRSGLDLIQDNRSAVEDADFAWIAYGTNDFPSNVPIGTNTDLYARWQDVATFKGAVNCAVETLKRYNPSIQIVFLTPIYRSDRTTNGKNGRLTDYRDAIVDLAAVHGYRAVDMYTGVGFTQENFLAGGAYTHDGLHPNAAGHRMMADFILSPKNTDPTVEPEKPPIEAAPCDVKFTKKYFAGKKVVSYGDSISAHATLNPGEKDYVDLLSEVLGFTATHLGRNSSRLTGKPPVETVVRPGVDLMTANRAVNAAADVAIIAYGTNDYNVNVPIGSEDDTYERWQDVDTFKGAIRFAVETLRAHNPDIRIVFLTPIYRNNRPQNEIGLRLTDYCDAVTALADKFGYLAIDMYNGVGFDETNFYSRSKYTLDQLHPNAIGHAKMAQYILHMQDQTTSA